MHAKTKTNESPLQGILPSQGGGHGQIASAAGDAIITAPKDAAKASMTITHQTGPMDFIAAGENRRFVAVNLDWLTFADIAAQMGMTDPEVRRLIQCDGFPKSSRRCHGDHNGMITVWNTAEFHAWKKARQAAAEAPVLLCKDCRHFSAFSDTCSAPGTFLMDLVWGESPQPCKMVRARDGKCGVSAVLFAARTPIDAPAPVELKTERAPYERRARTATGIDGTRTVTFATDHLIEIKLALEDQIKKLQKIIDDGDGSADYMSLRDSLDVTCQALELVR